MGFLNVFWVLPLAIFWWGLYLLLCAWSACARVSRALAGKRR
jgi:hypothetical protein